MLASRLWKKLDKHKYFILLYLLLKSIYFKMCVHTFTYFPKAWTKEASQLLQGNLEPVFRVSEPTTKLALSKRVEEDTDKVHYFIGLMSSSCMHAR